MILESRWNQGVGESDHSPTFIFSVEKIIRLFCGFG